jgi:hypothetical protein
MSACRFCHSDEEDDRGLEVSIKYGPRHYAHPDCFLKAKGAAGFDLLHDWQLETFPALAANRAGLFDVLVEQIENRKKLKAERREFA